MKGKTKAVMMVIGWDSSMVEEWAIVLAASTGYLKEYLKAVDLDSKWVRRWDR